MYRKKIFAIINLKKSYSSRDTIPFNRAEKFAEVKTPALSRDISQLSEN